MKDFLLLLIKGIMDAMEEFFGSLTAPSTKFTLNAFFWSVSFLVVSVAAEMFELPCFVQWPEALACTLLLLVIVLIDSSVRGNIKSGLGGLKDLASKFSYTGEEDSDDTIEMEGDGNGTAERQSVECGDSYAESNSETQC